MVKMLFMHIGFFSSNFKLITINKYKNGFGPIFYKLKKATNTEEKISWSLNFIMTLDI